MVKVKVAKAGEIDEILEQCIFHSSLLSHLEPSPHPRPPPPANINELNNVIDSWMNERGLYDILDDKQKIPLALPLTEDEAKDAEADLQDLNLFPFLSDEFSAKNLILHYLLNDEVEAKELENGKDLEKGNAERKTVNESENRNAVKENEKTKLTSDIAKVVDVDMENVNMEKENANGSENVNTEQENEWTEMNEMMNDLVEIMDLENVNESEKVNMEQENKRTELNSDVVEVMDLENVNESKNVNMEQENMRKELLTDLSLVTKEKDDEDVIVVAEIARDSKPKTMSAIKQHLKNSKLKKRHSCDISKMKTALTLKENLGASSTRKGKGREALKTSDRKTHPAFQRLPVRRHSSPFYPINTCYQQGLRMMVSYPNQHYHYHPYHQQDIYQRNHFMMGNNPAQNVSTCTVDIEF